MTVEYRRARLLSAEQRRAFGGLLPLLDDAAVRDILVHCRDDCATLWVDRGGGAQQIPGWSVPAAALRALVVELVASGGRHIDDLHPCANVRLGAGIRVHAVLPPVAVGGAALSIRVPSAMRPDFEQLVAEGLCDSEVAAQLRRAVLARRNLLITGGTATGKTTLLNALLGLVPANERIITIEDVAELQPRHSHHVALEARQANLEGAGAVGLTQLLREALRMRPDRLVLGECRGAELVTLLAALNTGHEGGAGTLHANSLQAVPARLEALGALAGLTSSALGRQAAAAIHLVVQVTREAGRHRIAHLGRLELNGRGLLEVNVIAA